MSEQLAVLLDQAEELAALPIPEPCSCPVRHHQPGCTIVPDPVFYDAGRQLRALQDIVPKLVTAVRSAFEQEAARS